MEYEHTHLELKEEEIMYDSTTTGSRLCKICNKEFGVFNRDKSNWDMCPECYCKSEEVRNNIVTWVLDDKRPKGAASSNSDDYKFIYNVKYVAQHGRCALEKCGRPFYDHNRRKFFGCQIDHRNGKASDNRFSNLRLLCPGCNAYLPTASKSNLSDRNPKNTAAPRHYNPKETTKEDISDYIPLTLGIDLGKLSLSPTSRIIFASDKKTVMFVTDNNRSTVTWLKNNSKDGIGSVGGVSQAINGKGSYKDHHQGEFYIYTFSDAIKMLEGKEDI